MQEPAWATVIIKEVCEEYNRNLPTMNWRQRAEYHTTGSTHYKIERIAITLGTDEQDHRLVLLHELAHYLNQSNRRGHTKEFWAIYESLIRKYWSE